MSQKPPINLIYQIDSLQKSYGSKSHPLVAVSSVSFDIRRGETLGLVGESGSGKSTIGRLLTRLTDPSGGRIIYHDDSAAAVDLAGLTQRQFRPYRSAIQIIFQDPYASLNPRRTIGQTLGEALDTHGLAQGSQRPGRIAELLEQVGLRPEDSNRYPHHFSGGQRQRIGIARALAVQPKFIVADEPLSALDVSVQAQVVNLLSDLKASLGLTLLFISHDLEVVEYLCDRVVVLYLGRIMEIAPVTALYRNPQHPYSQALLAASPLPDPRLRGQPRLALEGDIPSPINPPSGCVFRTRCPKAMAVCSEQVPMLREAVAGSGHWNACLLTQ